VEAIRRYAILQPTNLGPTSRIPIPIQRCDKPRAWWNNPDQVATIADLDPDEWDLPPKPKWMRWATYNRYSEQYDRYEHVLDRGCMALAAKFLRK
jgi:hypothetical protein